LRGDISLRKRYIAVSLRSVAPQPPTFVASKNFYITVDQGLDGREPVSGGVARPLLLKHAKETTVVESISTTPGGRSVSTAVFNQVEGGIIVRKQAIKAFVLLGLFLSLSAIYVNAQSKAPIRKVEIPFYFSVRDKSHVSGQLSVVIYPLTTGHFFLRSCS
jgi:hypothetical protein